MMKVAANRLLLIAACGIVGLCFAILSVAETKEADQERTSVEASFLSPEDRIREALSRPLELKYDSTPLEEVVKDLQEKLGVPVQLDHWALIDLGIDVDSPVTFDSSSAWGAPPTEFATSKTSAKQQIALMLRRLSLTKVIYRNVLLITTPEEAETLLTTEIYDVTDLVGDALEPDEKNAYPEQLINVLETCICPTTWDKVGGSGTLAAFRAAGIQTVVVSQTEAVHDEIDGFLTKLRSVVKPESKLNTSLSTPRSPSLHNQKSDSTIDSPEEIRFEEALGKKITFDFHEVPFHEVAESIQNLTGIPVILDLSLPEDNNDYSDTDPWRTRRENAEMSKSITIFPDTPVTAKAEDLLFEFALNRMLETMELSWVYDDGALRIVMRDKEGEFMTTRYYDVSDLPSYRDAKNRGVPDYGGIIELITSTIEPNLWSWPGGDGTIEKYDDAERQAIVVHQSWRVHKKIQSFFASLRLKRRQPPTAEEIARLPPVPKSRGQLNRGKLRTETEAWDYEETPSAPVEPDPARDAIVKASNQFAFDLYQQVAANKENRGGSGNIFFSPCSIATTLAMVYAGARGQTAEEMAQTLHLSLPQPEIPSAFRSLLKTLPENNQRGYQLTVANGFWGAKDYAFSDSYLTTIQERFGGELNRVDFNAPMDVREKINAWIEEKTSGKIKEFIGLDAIRPEHRFLLANAVFFQGEWADKFDKKLTKTMPFFIGEETIDVEMMQRVDSCNCGLVDGIKVLEKPYRSGDIAMMILLPEKGAEAFERLENMISPEVLGEWSRRLKERDVIIYLPRFQLIASLDLDALLPSMGMVKVFQVGQADLSGMHDDKELLALDRILHQASIQVDEEGTVTAAGTAGMGYFGAPPPIPVFQADHPFIFLIRDTRTDSILFMGRLMRP